MRILLASLSVYALMIFSASVMASPSASEGSRDLSSLPSPDAEKLTLEGSIDTALRDATSVLKARNNVTQTGAGLLQSYGQFLPTLDAQAGYNYNDGKTYLSVGPPTFVNAQSTGATGQLTATLNIFNGFSDLSSLKAATDRKTASELSLTRAKQQISLDVAQSFLQVVLDDQLVRIAQDNLKLSQAREQLLTEQTKVGVRNLADLFRQQAQTSSDEASLTSTRDKRNTDLLMLLRKLRLDLQKDYVIVEPPLEAKVETVKTKARETDQGKLIQNALANRSDLRASEQSASAAKEEVTAARSAYYPRLDLGANMLTGGRYFTQDLVNGVNSVPSPQTSIPNQLGNGVSYAIGLTLTWNLFDHFNTRLAEEQAQVAADNADIDYVDRQKKVAADVRQAEGDFQAAEDNLLSANKGLTAAQKAFEVMEGRYEVGSANFIDLISAQAALQQAQSAKAQAVVGLVLQDRAFDFALGATSTDSAR